MKITSVEPQKSSKGQSASGRKRFNIFLDGIFAFGADEDLVVDRRLIAGKEILPDSLEKLLQETEVGKLMERMYRLFNIRARSEKEIRDYFKNLSFKKKLKGDEKISEMVIDSVIEKLKKKGMVNDLEFTKAWMESRLKKYGVNRIKQELLQKGINREIIEEVISGQGTGYSEEVAQKLLEKKIARWKNLKPMEFRKKAYDFLLRRGFEYKIIKAIVEKKLKNRYNINI